MNDFSYSKSFTSLKDDEYFAVEGGGFASEALKVYVVSNPIVQVAVFPFAVYALGYYCGQKGY